MKKILLIILVIFANGCKDKINVSEENSTKDSKEEIEQRLANIDVAQLQGLQDVFDNNIEIKSENKPIMIIFGNNSCKYCEDLKREIRTNTALKDYIKSNVTSYYVNTSYSKNHNVAFMGKSLDTDSLSRHYNLSNTPLVLFLEPNGDLIIKMVGYNADFFPKMLEFAADSNNYKSTKDSTKRMQLFMDKYIKS
ncbi:thioredoxin fold domain-containing protein [Helicobacter saguini]|uniref:Thioredoxin fold domain-containing protein n=1 Tax=Helicobacter saguini TaxID=1548018 RepID=A0A347VPT5_9HELI|nr:thioredoxin fold domain-containing protein [Helicobacter saguini]MWV61223.1 thioredoxin fold domain-containing protein [Helicobacter saguini]MWV68110.1 thioredoxin fold domain-containing protein [Helicobacter saguini]MWV70426.1 thioredoxin fold domain-containing protein [Helicobacter saguini]MWV72327.1 thioredoxin fold domain-containing protein [Helicobacter saguini]TLD92979.1 hypothetical protein LS64_009290 [Helicobacter saguini]